MSTVLEWRAKQLLDRTSLSRFLSVEAYDEQTQTFRLDDGRLGILWTSDPLLGLDDTRIQKLVNLFESDLPIGTTFQFSLHSCPVIEPILRQYESLTLRSGTGPQYFRQAKAISDFFRQSLDGSLTKVSTIQPRDVMVYVSMTLPIEGFNEHGMGEELAHQTLSGVEAQLKGVGLQPHRMTALDLIWLFYVLLNPMHAWDERPPAYDPEIPLRDQFIMRDTAIDVREGCLVVDKQYLKCMSVQAWPKRWWGAKNREFIGSLMKVPDQITAPFFITMNVVKLDQMAEKARISKKHMINTQQAKGWLLDMIPIFRTKQENYAQTVHEVEDAGRQYIGQCFQVMVYGRTAKEMQQQSDVVKSLYRAHDITLVDDERIGVPMLLAALPLGLRSDVKYLRDSLQRIKTTLSTVPANCCPIVGDWKGGGEPIMLFTSRMGQVVGLDLFANTTGNFNAAVIAKSGAGKSFFINNLICSYLQTGGRVWMIDAGYSYVKLCEILGGQYIQYSTQGARMCFNPFTKLVHWDGGHDAVPLSDQEAAERDKDRADEMAVLSSVIAQMASPYRPVDAVEEGFIDQAVMKVLQAVGPEGSPDEVMKVLECIGDQRARDLALVLEKFSKRGQYGRLFNGKNNIDFENDFVVVEMDGLGDQKALGSVLLFCVQMNIQAAMYEKANKGRRKYLGMDEAWDLLSGGGNTAKFFEKGVRRVRKYGGSILTITQSVFDYIEKMGECGSALLASSDFKFLLSQLPEVIAKMRETQAVKLTDYEYQLLGTVERTKEYSDTLAITPFGRGIMRLVVPRRSQLLFTTNADELQVLDNIRAQSGGAMSYQDAIDRYLELEAAHAAKR